MDADDSTLPGRPSQAAALSASAWKRYRLHDWTTWALWVNGVLLALYLIWVPYHWSDETGAGFGAQLANLLLALALELQLVLAAVAWRASTAATLTRRRRLGWRLFALACFVYWVGNLFYFYFTVVLKVPAFPSIADAGYLAFYPLVFAALLCFSQRLESRVDRVQFWIDAATVMVGSATLVWYFLLQPLAQASYSSGLEQALTLAYPLGDTLLLFGVGVLLLRHRRGEFRTPLAWLVLGMVLHFIADISFAYQTLQGNYEPGGINGALYNSAYFLMLIGAYLEFALVPRESARAEGERSARSFSPLPYVVVGLAYALLLIVSRPQWNTPLGGLIVAAVLLTGLVIVRQVLAVQENARLRAEQATRATESRFSSMVRNSSDVISLLGPDNAFQFVSASSEHVYGYAPAALLKTSMLALIHPQDQSHAADFLHDALSRRASSTASTEWRLLHRDGRWRNVETIVTNLSDDPAVGGLVLNSRDVTERKLLEQQLRHLAFHDPLTQLANRTLFRVHVEHALMRASRNGQVVSVLFLDLDNFKVVNDSIGHAEGDSLLKETAARLIACSRPHDTVARLGGDEFALLIDDPLGQDDVIIIAERIAAALAAPVSLAGREVKVTASIGIAQGKGSDADALLRNADVAMYAVKNHGKRGYALFESRMHAAVLERVDLEADFAKALERQEFRLLYQPIIELETGACVGVEALVRWHHPQRGVVPPAVFIPLAEENGELIVRLGRWILVEAARQGKIWQDRNPAGLPFHIDVNISVRQLQFSDLVKDVASALEASRFDPRRLVLEITESALMQRTDQMLRTLNELKDAGVQLAIDDFGMGYSSLSYLHRFPVDILKIDKSFIDRIGEDADGGRLSQAIIALGDTLHMETIAEGVEHPRQAAELARLGCRYAQGYLFSKPITTLEVDAQWLSPGQRRSGHLGQRVKPR